MFKSFPLHESARDGQYQKVDELLSDETKDIDKLIDSVDEDERTVRIIGFCERLRRRNVFVE